MNFFSRYQWSPLALFMCFLFIAYGLTQVDEGGIRGWVYMAIGLFCFFVWKRPKVSAPPAVTDPPDPSE